MNQVKIPDGYRMNANGDLVLIQNIKEIDLLRDELVTRIAEKSEVMSGELAEFRNAIMEDIQTFVTESARRFKTRMGGPKGNLSLFSFDGRYKVLVAVQEYIAFDERLQIAKNLIDACIKRWSSEARPELLALVNDAFQVDKAQNVSIRRVLGLRQINIPNDPQWEKAMKAIGESLKVVSSKSYLRVYRRADNGEYRPISLDVANV